MDPITAAILAALGAGALKGVGKLGQDVLSDAYEGLKNLLRRKFGEQGDVAQSVANLEQRPDSTARAGMLAEALGDVKANDDPEIVAAAKALLEQIEKLPGGDQVVQQVTGSSNVALAAGGSSASVTVQSKSAE
jgi:hypothetical protein